MNRGGNKIASQKHDVKTLPKPRRGRVKKAKPKKPIKINGLDLLHSQTLLSTSPQGILHISLEYAFSTVIHDRFKIKYVEPLLNCNLY